MSIYIVCKCLRKKCLEDLDQADDSGYFWREDWNFGRGKEVKGTCPLYVLSGLFFTRMFSCVTSISTHTHTHTRYCQFKYTGYIKQ